MEKQPLYLRYGRGMEAAYRGEPIEESMNPEILEKHDISVKIEILGKQNWMKDLIRPPEQGINKNITYILAQSVKICKTS